MKRSHNLLPLLCGVAVSALPVAAFAQEIPASSSERSSQRSRIEITPYIEAAQVVSAQISPGNDVVTYSRLAAGVDASINGRNNQASVSIRYERMIGWEDDAPDGDVISGLARASIGIVPRTLSLEAGAMASRTSVDASGRTAVGPFSQGDQSSQIYSIYAGPSLSTHVGDVAVDAHYRLGYSRVEAPDLVTTGTEPIDVFDDSVTHSAAVRAGFRPGTVLPIGVSVVGGFNQEDMSTLDQRVRDTYARVDVTVPLSPTLAVVGGVGYENVEVSSRDALVDGDGNPVLDEAGRFVTDENSPREIAFEADGLIWDAGVIWRPSRRTQLEAHVGRRYDSTSYYGNFGWQATSRTSLNVSVYDSIGGLGGMLTNTLAGLPTEFITNRNPLTGDLGGCQQSAEGGNCLGGALSSLRGSTFRARGITASVSTNLGRTKAGLGVGYENRKFIAAQGTALAGTDGVTDENYWMSGYLSTALDNRSAIGANAYVNFYQNGSDLQLDQLGYGASLAYQRELIARLTAMAGVSIDGLSVEELDDILVGSALVGMRYSF